MDFSVYLPNPTPNKTGAQPVAWPQGSEDFYRNTSNVDDIKARVRDNAVEQDTYVNSVNHEMDEIAARTTGNGGNLYAEDAARLKELKTQMKSVMADNTGPEDKAFTDKLWFAVDRAKQTNPADLDYLDMSGDEIAPLVKGNRKNQEEYLFDADNELDELSRKVADKTAGKYEQDRYHFLKGQLETVIRANPEEVSFNWEMQSRLDRLNGDYDQLIGDIDG